MQDMLIATSYLQSKVWLHLENIKTTVLPSYVSMEYHFVRFVTLHFLSLFYVLLALSFMYVFQTDSLGHFNVQMTEGCWHKF